MGDANGHVLIVDDDGIQHVVLEAVLSEHGYSMHSAYSGFEAMDALEQHCVDIVILDIEMPGMGGLEALARIRRDYPHMPVIMASGVTHADMIAEVLRAGATAFVSKPVSFGRLVSIIEHELGRSAQKRARTGCN